MSIQTTLQRLIAKRDALNVAIAEVQILEGKSTVGEPREPKAKRRKMSAAARKKISDAQKARWSKVKKH